MSEKSTSDLEPYLHPDETKFQDCRDCGAKFPLTTEFYDKDKSTESGFRTICKACRALDRSKIHARQEDVINRHDTDLVDMVYTMTRLEGSQNNLPHMSSVLENLMRVFGGAEGFARHIALNYAASKPGSMVRNKTLQAIMSLAVKVSEAGVSQVPLEHMTDADIEREIQKRAGRLTTVYEDFDGEETGDRYEA